LLFTEIAGTVSESGNSASAGRNQGCHARKVQMFGYKRLWCPLGHAFSAFVYGSSSHVVCPQCKAISRQMVRDGSGTPPPYDFSAASLMNNDGNSVYAAYNNSAMDPRDSANPSDFDRLSGTKP
jgi:hypothetical protein